MYTKPIHKYVVAGNHRQFLNYVNKKAGDGVLYHYVSGPDQLRGLSEISGVFIGTFEERKDIEEIRLQIKLIQSRDTLNSYKTWTPSPGSRHDDIEVKKLLMTAYSMTQEQFDKISPTAFQGET